MSSTESTFPVDKGGTESRLLQRLEYWSFCLRDTSEDASGFLTFEADDLWRTGIGIRSPVCALSQPLDKVPESLFDGR